MMLSNLTARLRNNLLLAPAAAVLGFLFFVPMSYFFVLSFCRVSLFRVVPAFDAANYARVWSDYLGPIAFTVGISVLIAAITTAIGFIVAHLIWERGGRWGSFLLAATLLTMFGGYLIKIYAWRTLLGREGIINATLVTLGITKGPLDALLFSPFAVILVLVSYLLPFAILPLFGALRSIEPTSLDAARDLGATPFGVLRDAVLPRCVTAIMTAFALSFLVAAGDYVTPRLVGGTQSLMMGNFIESQFGLQMNTPMGAAMTYSTLATSVAVIASAWLALRTLLRPR